MTRRCYEARRDRRVAAPAAPMPQTHLVADRAEARGPLLGRDPLVALPAEQHDLVAALHRVVAAVDHQLVHRDGADDRPAAAADQHVAVRRQAAAHAVGVAQRHGRDVGVGGELVAQPVGQPVAGGQPLDERHPGLQRHAPGAARRQVVDAGARRDAVDAMPARTNDRRAPGWASAPAELAAWTATPPSVGSAASTSSSRASWPAGVRVVGLVGDGEVGEDARQPQPRRVAARCAATKPARRPGAAPTRCMPVSILRWTSRPRTRGAASASIAVDRRHRRRQPVGDDRRGVVGRLLAEHEDRRVDPGLAQRDALLRSAPRTARRTRRPARLGRRRRAPWP